MNALFLELLVVLLGLLLLMIDAFAPRLEKTALAYVGAAGLGFVLLLTFLPQHLVEGTPAAAFYAADTLALFFKRFTLISTIIVLLMSVDFTGVIERFVPAERRGAGVGEFFILPIFACAGMMWLVSATDFIMIFVSLELVTITFYILVAYLRQSPSSLEAGTKYLILGALSTGFLVYGITWIFGITETTSLPALPAAIAILPGSALQPLLFGIALLLVALGFKIAAVPFQFWVPDVYQGAPTPVTAFLSVASKAAGFVVLLRLLQPLYVIPVLGHKIMAVTTLLAGLTLLYGNLAAIPQTNMKRLLSYSSIAHAGYLLMGVASIGSALTGRAIGFYLAAYLPMTFLAFFILMLVSEASGGDEITRFHGLGQRSPLLAGAMLIAMLSLAGIPFTGGFFGKFLIFEVALKQGHFGLLFIGTLSVATGFYYYLKVIRAMYWQQPAENAGPIAVSKTAKFLIALLLAGIFSLGLYPGPVLAALR